MSVESAAKALGDALRGLQRTAGLKRARVDAVNADGTFRVEGVTITAVRGVQPKVGEIVWVSHKSGRPTLIVKLARRPARRQHQDVRRLGIIEELYVAPDPDTGLVEVWFRNHGIATPLGLRPRLPADPTGVKWGADRDSFVVLMRPNRFSVFTFERAGEQEPFGAGEAPDPTLEATHDLFAPTHVLLDGTFTRSGAGKRVTATQAWEETRTATVQSFTIQNPGVGNDPDVCLVVGISTSCRTQAQVAEFLNNVGNKRAEMPEPPNCVTGTGGQLEVLSFVADPPPENAHLGNVKKDEGNVSVATEVHRLIRLNQALYDEVAAVEGDGDIPEFTPVLHDYSLTADHQVIAVILLRVQFSGNIRPGDTQDQSSVAYRYPESFQDPNWVTPLQAIEQAPDTLPNIKAAFDIRETHVYVVNVSTGTLLWSTTGAHVNPVKALAIDESYATLDTKSLLSQQAFDGPWLNWDQLVNTGIEPPHAGTRIGTAGQAAIIGSWNQVVGDPLFIGIGLSTMEVRRITSIGLVGEDVVNTLDAPLAYDHYATEPVRAVPALVYWETQQTGDPACNIRKSLVATVEPTSFALPGAKTMTLGTIGTQGRTGFQNDLWNVAEFDTSGQYSSTTQGVAGTPHMNSASYLISVPLNYGDDNFVGLEVSWSFTWQWVRQLKRYSVQDMRLITWHPQSASRRWWFVLEARDLVTGHTQVRGFVLNGSFTPIETVEMLDDSVATLLASTPRHIVWHEGAPGAQRVMVADLARQTGATFLQQAAAPDLKARWQEPDVRGLAPDLLYRTLDEGEEGFVEGWDLETGEILMNPLSQDFPIADDALADRGGLASGEDPTASRSYQLLNEDDEFGEEPELG